MMFPGLTMLMTSAPGPLVVTASFLDLLMSVTSPQCPRIFMASTLGLQM